ncbi:hypothetical protein [Caulobacter sp. DWP3-1-3b2]|uniref:hypothetical protein n=1 Tax=Caulobacter sp. DWP3-1-3b2 TaxID=2804643 RepID=UPI003CE6E56A
MARTPKVELGPRDDHEIFSDESLRAINEDIKKYTRGTTNVLSSLPEDVIGYGPVQARQRLHSIYSEASNLVASTTADLLSNKNPAEMVSAKGSYGGALLKEFEQLSLDVTLRSISSKKFDGTEAEELDDLLNKLYNKLEDCISINESAIEAVINNDYTFDNGRKSLDERYQLLDRFTASYPGLPISAYVRKLFPEHEIYAEDNLRVEGHPEGVEALPSNAPALWISEKKPGDSPPAFIKRHYAPWLGKGLARPDIKRLDPQLYVALNNWLRNNEMPADLDLPTLKEKNDRWAERVLPGGDLAADAEQVLRVNAALRMRQKRTKD